MTSISKSKLFNRLVVATGIVVALTAIIVASAFIVPSSTLVQASEPDRIEPDLIPTAVFPPPPLPLPSNPPTATPEPGAVQTNSGSRARSSDLEVVRFRPDTVLRLGESLPSIAAEKPAGAADSSNLRRPPGETSGPQEVYQAPDVAGLLSPLDWVRLAYEGFVGFSPPAVGIPFSPTFGTSSWVVYDFPNPDYGDDGFERTWGAADWISYYHEDDPSDVWSAWPAAFGADALDPNQSYYTNTLNSWMVYGPIDLSNMADAFVSFGLWYQTEPEYDQFFFGVSTNGTAFYGDFWSGDSGGWTDQAYWLTSYAGYSEVWLAWTFQSDGSIVDDGPFVDEIWVWGDDLNVTPTPAPTPDPSGEMIENGSFETADLTGWQSYESPLNPLANGDFEYGPGVSWAESSTHGWPLVVNSFPGSVTPHSGSWAAWLGGDYDDISAIVQNITVPSGSSMLSYWYWIASADDVCGNDFGGVRIDSMVVDAFNLCDSNDTNGWVRRTVDLSTYVGQTVQLDIRAETDSSLNSNLFIDDVALGSLLLALDKLQTVPHSASRPETDNLAEPKSNSQLSRNPLAPAVEVPNLLGTQRNEPKPDSGELPSPVVPEWPGGSIRDLAPFSAVPQNTARESSSLIGLADVTGPLGVLNVWVSDLNQFDGNYAAHLWRPHGQQLGVDYLYQTIAVPADATDVVLNFWFGVATNETVVGNDWFCASVADSADHNVILVDFGCIDATDTAPYWQEMLYALNSTELAAVVGKSVDLIFYLFSDFDIYGLGVGSGATTAPVDYVRVYATGGSAGGSIDPNEPNDDYSEATSLNCGDTISGTIGDALGGYDIDWFELNSVPTGQIDVDIDADTLIPPSALDSVLGLWDSGPSLVTSNDDDGVSFDSYITYTNGITNATFYVSVESYSGDGSPDSFYDLTVQCAGSGSGPPPSGGEQTPPDNTWTVMLYLNAEDPNFESILTQYRTDIEAFIGGKSAFLNVVILYDGPSGSIISGTTRYLVQPNGNYTPGTNIWDMGELNVGHPDTLANFVSWAMDQYPAEHYYLAIDDHGDGAYGISVDPTSSNDQLTPPELYSALKSATHNGSRKIDIFDYEACLMGLAENAYDLREWVDYVIFFEQISWGINTYPLYFSDLSATDTALDVGRRIIDRYHAGANAAGYPHTVSLIDTSQMEAVGTAVNNFGNTIKTTDTQDQKDAVNDARDNSQAFAADIDATNPVRAEYIDLWDLADEASALAATQAAAVKSAVDAAVVYERHANGGVSGYIWDHSGVHGLSIYYPTTKSSSAFSGYGSLYQMSQGGGWDEFLEWVLPAGMGRGMSSHRAEIRLTGGDTFIFRYVYLPVVLK